ncbi:zinc finger BED domain-containing protein 1 [Nannospalax galili]|uniref:zinc finger BED domain-containing protein 1 n=1 Tax=Nannospalax galili TaxID=1026970 RepID=UPI0004ED5AE7|nr:zinc finger BED domain-containing protein 1 [Nannospalax galili]XP_008851283.1 zinc finger BED domain-containing protein 1 [Nannospalax galili]
MEDKVPEVGPADGKPIPEAAPADRKPAEAKASKAPEAASADWKPAPEVPAGDRKLVAHPRAKSKVWKYFGFDSDAEGCIVQWRKIYCRVCRAQIAYSGNTSNLSYHLEKNHPDQYCELVRSNTEHMREAFASAYSRLKPDSGPGPCRSPQPPPSPPDAFAPPRSSLGYDTKRHRDITAAVLGVICEGLFPASVVDEPTFRALLRAAEPRYELPGRKYFLQAVPEKYARVRDAVRKELGEAAWCGVSADLWASPSHNRTYVTLAVHRLGVTSQGGLALTSRCLKTFEVPDDDDAAETVTRVLYEVFVEWGLGSKVFAATTDFRKDLVQACSLLDVPVHLPCLASTLDAGIQQALRLPRLAALLARCRKLVRYFQGCSVARCLLYEKQRQHGLPRGMLVSDRVPGWGSTLLMLRRLKEQQFCVAAVLLADSNNHHLMLEAAEYGTLDALLELLQPFRQVAEVLGSKYPTISMVKPLLHMLLNTTLVAKDTECTDISTAKELIARELTRKYRDQPEVDMFLNVATFLDPRYKRLPFLSGFDRQRVELRVIEEAKAFLDRDGDRVRCAMTESPADGVPEDPPAKRFHAGACTEPPGTAIHSMLAEIFCPAGATEDQEENHAQVVEELGNFKSQKVLGLSQDPLKWWSDRRALFPVLPRVLQKYWCVVPTRVAPERLFGSAARVVSAKRNRLAPAHVDEQVFLYENARAVGDLEPEDEDEGDWGLGPDGAGFLGARDAGFL